MNSSVAGPVHFILLLILGMLAVLLPLMPLQLPAESTVLPDLLLPLLAAWSVRRPDTVPLLLVAGLLLFADLALERPVGLWALISLGIVETMRGQREVYRNRPFPAEWAAFALALAVGLLAQGLILSIALVPQPGFAVMARVFVWTVLIYPVVVGLLHWVVRVRAPKPAERSRRLGRVA